MGLTAVNTTVLLLRGKLTFTFGSQLWLKSDPRRYSALPVLLSAWSIAAAAACPLSQSISITPSTLNVLRCRRASTAQYLCCATNRHVGQHMHVTVLVPMDVHSVQASVPCAGNSCKHQDTFYCCQCTNLFALNMRYERVCWQHMCYSVCLTSQC